MTSAEWQEAFRRGDPDAIGTAVLTCIREAHVRAEGHADLIAIDIGQLALGDADEVHDFGVLIGTLMLEHGLLYQLRPGMS